MAPLTIIRTQDLTTARPDEYISFNPCDVCSILLFTIVTFFLALILLSINNNMYSIFALIFINVIYQVIRVGWNGIAILRLLTTPPLAAQMSFSVWEGFLHNRFGAT